jgi:Tfp pilus assembly protein PilF
MLMLQSALMTISTLEERPMRTHLFRATLTLIVALAFTASAAAQAGMVKGKVLDQNGEPVEGATIVMVHPDNPREVKTTTNEKGEFVQIGLRSGRYTITASKDNVGAETVTATVRQGGSGVNYTFNLSAISSLSTGDQEKVVALQEVFAAASAASRAGDHDLAIAKYTEAIGVSPDCKDCYLNIGFAHSDEKRWPEAVAAFTKAIELDANLSDAYSGLAAAYNAQKKFDLAQEAGAKAASLASTGGGAGSGGAEQAYNQGVILFNGQKYAEAKVQFETAVNVDPRMALAQYQLGMTSLNLGQIPDAVKALEAYLEIEPNGDKASEVNTALPALKAMVQ